MNSKSSVRAATSSKGGIYYKEDPSMITEPSKADIVEYAKRIGINVTDEPHLLPIARQGLIDALPHPFVPCIDPMKDSLFYYNTVTTESTWEHPLTNTHRQKVVQEREAHTKMEQEKDAKKLKGLPPLRRGAGGLGGPPLVPIKSFDPIKNPPKLPEPSRPDLFKAQSNNAMQFPNPPGRLGRLQPMAPIPTKFNAPASIPNDRDHSKSGSDLKRLEAPDPNRPKSLIGVLKKSNPSSNDFQSRTTQETGSSNRFGRMKKDSEDSDSESGQKRTDNRQKDVRVKAKGNVRFNLDEDPELKFDISSHSSDLQSGSDKSDKKQDGTSTNDDSSAENTELDEDQSSKNSSPRPTPSQQQDKNRNINAINEMMAKVNSVKFDALIDASPKKGITATAKNTEANNAPKRLIPPVLKPYQEETESNKNTKRPIFNQVTTYNPKAGKNPGGEKITERPDQKQKEKLLEQDLENDMKKFKEELDKARKEREAQLKKEMEEALILMKSKNEEEILNIKQDYEKNREEMLKTIKNEHEERLTAEISEIRNEFGQKIKKRKDELAEESQMTLKELEKKASRADLEAQMEEKRNMDLKELEREATEHLKFIKDGVKRDHDQQIEQMRAYHKTFTETLRSEFKIAEAKAKREQESKLTELLKTLDEEKTKLIETSRAEHEAEIQKMNEAHKARREALEAQLTAEIQNIESKLRDRGQLEHAPNEQKTYNESPGKSIDKEYFEKQTETQKSKYRKLQEKYDLLKQGLSSVVASEQDRMHEEIHMRSGQGSESDVDTGPSYDMSDSVEKKAHDSNSDFKIDDMIDGSNDRLNQALAALDILREQLTNPPNETTLPSKARDAPARQSASKDNIRGRKSDSQSRLNVYPTKKSGDYLLAKPRSSRSATNIEENGYLLKSPRKPAVNENEQQIVQEAKDFIRSQKHRLNQPLHIHGSGRVSAGEQQQRRIADLIKSSNTAILDQTGTKLLNNRDLFSETESSGLGSLHSHMTMSNDRSQVTKEIDSILVSLKNLDVQMKTIWSAVGEPKSGNPSTAIEPNFNYMNSFGQGLLTPLIHPMTPNALAQLNLMAKSGVTDNPLSSLHSSISPNDLLASRYSLGPEFLTGAGQGNNGFMIYPQSNSSQSQFPQLDEHIQNLKNRRDELLKYPPVQYFGGTQLPDSLDEKTKDLREWLEKF